MKRLQVGDECYVRIRGGVILRAFWSETVADFINHHRYYVRLVYPYPIIKQLAK
jgi:hypothetical protein